MAFQEIVAEDIIDVPVPPLTIAILDTLKQLSERFRCVKIVACMGGMPGRFLNAEVCDPEAWLIINIKFRFRNEYIPRMQITMLFSTSLQLNNSPSIVRKKVSTNGMSMSDW